MQSYQHESQKEEAEKGHARGMCSWQFFPFLSPFTFLDLRVSLPLCSLLFCPQDRFFRDLSSHTLAFAITLLFWGSVLRTADYHGTEALRKKSRRLFGSRNFMSSGPCIQLILFLASYCIVSWDSLTPGSHQVCLPLPFLQPNVPKQAKSIKIRKAQQRNNGFTC